MRKRFRVLLFAALVAALVVPVGFAWSIDATPARTAHVNSHSTVARASATATLTSSVVIAAPVAERATRDALNMPPVPDAAKLLLVGTTLFGLAAVLRKAI